MIRAETWLTDGRLHAAGQLAHQRHGLGCHRGELHAGNRSRFGLPASSPRAPPSWTRTLPAAREPLAPARPDTRNPLFIRLPPRIPKTPRGFHHRHDLARRTGLGGPARPGAKQQFTQRHGRPGVGAGSVRARPVERALRIQQRHHRREPVLVAHAHQAHPFFGCGQRARGDPDPRLRLLQAQPRLAHAEAGLLGHRREKAFRLAGPGFSLRLGAPGAETVEHPPRHADANHVAGPRGAERDVRVVRLQRARETELRESRGTGQFRGKAGV